MLPGFKGNGWDDPDGRQDPPGGPEALSPLWWAGGIGNLRALCGGHLLLHGAPLMRDQAAEAAVRFPLVRRQALVAAGRVIVVALLGGLGGLHTLGDGAAICLPGNCHAAGVEVADEAHQGGLVGAELLRGGREECDRGGGLGLTCGDGRPVGQGRCLLCQHLPECWCGGTAVSCPCLGPQAALAPRGQANHR